MSGVSNNTRILKNTLFLYIRMGLVMLVSLYTARIVLKVLGAEDYGIFNVVCGFVSMFSVLNACLNTATNRFYNFAIGKDDNAGVTNVYNASVLIQIILIVVLVILLESVGLWYLNNKMVIPVERLPIANIIFQFSVISTLFVVLQIPYSAAVLAYEKMDFYALVSIIDVFVKLGFVISLQYISIDKLLFYGAFMSFMPIFDFVLYFIYCRRKFPLLKFERFHDKQLFRSLIGFSSWSTLDPMTRTIQHQGSSLVFNYFFGPIMNAANGLAGQISSAVDGFTQNIAVAFRPQITQSYAAGDYSRTKYLMFTMSKVNFGLHLLLSIPLIVDLKPILKLWLGDSFPDHTVSFACIVLIVRTLDCLHAPISTVMVATGRIKKIKLASLIIMSSIVPLSIVLFYLGLQPEMLYVLMIFLTIVNITVSALILCKTFTYISIRDYLYTVIKPCLLLICVLALPVLGIYTFIPSSLYRLLITCVVVVVVSSITVYCFILSESEKVAIKTLLIKKLKIGQK